MSVRARLFVNVAALRQRIHEEPWVITASMR